MLVLGASAVALSGCANRHEVGPEAWWHDAIGGRIAAERPAPPGDKDPFPNLATVPPRPAKADAATWNRMTAGLIGDRVKANEAAALAPIPTAGPPAAPNIPAPPVQEPGASAAFVGVGSGPGARPTSPSSAAPQAGPPGIVPAPSPQVARPAGSTLPNTPPPPAVAVNAPNEAARVAGGRLPPLPAREPPRPGIAPPPPPPVVPVTATPPFQAPRPGTEIDFPRQAATLNDAALADVNAIAASRGNHGIAITGYGEALSSDATGQSEALDLGLRRAQALATALVARGVPYAFLRLNAEAAGRGASLRLLQ